AGLLRLKPEYLTIKECKAQRKFKTNKGEIKRAISKITEQAKIDYLEYEERHEWWLEVKRKSYERDLLDQKMRHLEGHLRETNIEDVKKDIEKEVKQHIDADKASKQKLESFIQDKVNNMNRNNQGRYTLAV
ncbi:MAG TPA: hypothetical protein VGF75_01440, partial [Candidatus Saccharimonadales bacterium]